MRTAFDRGNEELLALEVSLHYYPRLIQLAEDYVVVRSQTLLEKSRTPAASKSEAFTTRQNIAETQAPALRIFDDVDEVFGYLVELGNEGQVVGA